MKLGRRSIKIKSVPFGTIFEFFKRLRVGVGALYFS